MKAYKVFKKVMDCFAMVEKVFAALLLLVVSAITFGNVVSRYVLPTSWSFTEELVINLFVFLSLMGVALAVREEGGLVSMAILSNALSRKSQRIMNILMCIFGLLFCYILIKYGSLRVETLINNHKRTDVLRIFEWKFALAIPICGACMTIHLIEFAIDNIVCLVTGKENPLEGDI